MFSVNHNWFGYWVSDGNSHYVLRNLGIGDFQELGGYLTKGEAEKRLELFLAKQRVEAGKQFNRDSLIQGAPTPHILKRHQENHVQLLLEGAPIPQLTPVGVRVVTDGDAVVLELRTPDLPFFPVARLEVKGGRVVMYRERGVRNELVNTDEEGRIQN